MYYTKVYNSNKETIRDAKVTIKKAPIKKSNDEEDINIGLFNDSEQAYVFPPLVPGRYLLKVKKRGYVNEETYVAVSNLGLFHEVTLFKTKSKSNFIYSGATKLPVKFGRFIKLEVEPDREIKPIEQNISIIQKSISKPKSKKKSKKVEELTFENQPRLKGIVLKLDNLSNKDVSKIISDTKKGNDFIAAKEVIIDENGSIGEIEKTIYIKFFAEVEETEKAAFFKKKEVNLILDSNFDLDGYLIEYTGKMRIFEYIEKLLKSGLFEFVEPEIHFENELTSIVPPDFLFQHQWYMPLVNVTDAWEALKTKDVNKTFGDADVVIAIFDTGLQTNTNGAGVTNSLLADFNGNVKGGELSAKVGNNRKTYSTYDFRRLAPGGATFSLMVPNNNTLEPSVGTPSPHGVGCAGVASGMAGGSEGTPGNQGVVGAAPNTRLIGTIWGPGRTRIIGFNHAMAWSSGIDPQWWADGATYSNAAPVGIQTFPARFNTPGNIGHGASILSHSHTWSGAALGALAQQNVNNITDYGRNKRGTLIFFAAGNGDALGAPSMRIGVHEKVFTVAASSLDQNGMEVRAPYSNWGIQLRSGPAAFPNNRTDLISGIDFCAPSHYYYAFTPPGVFSNPVAPWGSTTEHAPPMNRAVISGALQGLGNLPITNTSQTTLTAILTPTSIQVAAAGPAFAVGNAILIGPPNSPTAEGARITGVAGTTITLSHSLKQAHVGGGVTPVAAGQADARDSFGGTSSACPLSVGIAALVLSANPNLTFYEVRNVLQTTAQPIDFRLTTDVNGAFMGWNTTGGAPIIDGNDLMVVNAAPAASTTVNGNFVAGATSVQLASTANLSVGQVILFGAESRLTANAASGTNSLTLASTNNFAPGMSIRIGDGPSTHLSGNPSTLIISYTAPPASTPITLAPNTIIVGNNRGFKAGQRITIGTGANQETHTIARLGITSVLVGGVPSAPISILISTGITLTANLANAHPKYAPVALANTEQHVVQPGAIVAGTLNLVGNLANTHNQGGANPRVWVRSTNCEIRIIKAINGNTITIDPLQYAQNNSPVTGGLTPNYSVSLGYGRLDAAAAVNAALNYNHDLRDLIIRNELTDTGLTATDVNKQIDSPDIWVRNVAPIALPVVAPNAPASYQTDGNTVHQEPRRAGSRSVMVRVGNRGSLTSFDFSLQAYVSLTDVEVDNPIVDTDYMRGPTRPSPNPASPTVMPVPYQISSNRPGTFKIGTVRSAFNTPASYLPPVAAGNAFIGQVTWNQADVPTLPLTFASVMLMSPVINGNNTIQVNHTRGFKVGQTILVGLPTTANQFTATVQSFTDQVITLSAAVVLGATIPTGVRVMRLAANPTTIKTAIPAPTNTIVVDDASTFTPGQYILVGPPGNATSEIKRITAITYNNAGDDTITIGSNLANARIVTDAISRIEGKLKTFVLAEVTPHDGLLAGKTPYDNNNMSCKEVFLGHKISFLDNSDNKLGDQVQVASNGTEFTVNFRVRVQDPENFTTEAVQLTVYRTATNGNVDTATYRFNGAGPWTLTGGGTWLTVNAPVLTAGGTAGAVAATLVQQDIWFVGSFKVKNTHSQVRIIASAPDVGTTFTTIESYSAKIVTANAPTGTAAQIQSKSGQAKLGGTQRMFSFADMANLQQSASQAFGPIDTNRFRVTSLFSTAAATNVMAYAVLDGLVFVQENPANNTMNLILRPFKQAEIAYTKVKYFIYRGLRKVDFVNTGTPAQVRADGNNFNGNFIDNLHLTNTALNPGVPLTLASLNWDNKPKEGFLDDYFFSSDPNSQLPVVDRGMELGRFHNLLPTDEFGLEIVLAEGDYSLTIENAQASSTIIDVSGVSDANEKRWRREQILNYVDPAAYFGMHYYGKLLYPTIPDPDANAINSVTYEKAAIYTNVVSKFFTRNTIYVDIRNEHGYSYNYDDTYTVKDSSPENGNQLKVGLTPTGQTSPPVARKYEFMEWPILVYNNASTPVQTSEDTNSIYLNLGWNRHNSDPQVYVERGYVLTSSSQNRFISRSHLLDSKAVINIDAGTSKIRVHGDITSELTAGDFISLTNNSIAAANKVYRILLFAVVAGGHTEITVDLGTIPAAAAGAAKKGRIAYKKWTKDIGLSFPNHPDSTTPTQRRNVAGVLKMRYFTRINPNVRSITALNKPAKQFTVRGNITSFLKVGEKFIVRNTVPVGANHNDGEYTVATGAGSLTLVGGNTQITVDEVIPAAGPANGEILLTDQKKIKTSRYFDNIFGSIGALTRRLPISSMTIVSPTVTNIVITGNFLNTVQQNARLNIVRANIPGNNINGATITNTVLDANGNTVITIQNGAGALVADTTGFIQLFYSIWKTTEPTRWITGFDRRFIDAKKDPLSLVGKPLVGFSYVAQTGIALETDNVIFYATPIDFFEPPTANRVPNSISMNGGTSTEDSFWKVMQNQNQRLKVITTILKIGADEIPVYDFEDYPGDSDHDKMKENFFALCITKLEMESLIVAANQAFTDFHDNYLVLRNETSSVDDNTEFYKRYEVKVNGWALINGKMVEREVSPAAPVYVYTLTGDSLVFTSKNYPNLGSLLSESKVHYEEELRLKTEALAIFNSNGAVSTIVSDFQAAMNGLTNNYTAMKAALLHADLLWATAVGTLLAQDDRVYYWARLHMRVIIRNHPYLKKQRRRMYEMLTLLQNKSRGISSIDFSAAGALDKKILIIAFDPYGLDKLEDPAYNIKMSNPGAVAAHELHDQSITDGAVTGHIQSVVLPVRFRTQQRGDLEKMVLPLLTGANKVDMIVTVNHNRPGRYDIERFASRYRNDQIKDNNNRKGGTVAYYYAKPDNTAVPPFTILRASTVKRAKFIESNLPETDMIPGTLGNNLVIYNQQYTTSDPAIKHGLSATGSGTADVPFPSSTPDPKSGSSGTYLFNEAFYRIGSIRTDVASTTKTGHISVERIQGTNDDFDLAKSQTVSNRLKQLLIDALLGL